MKTPTENRILARIVASELSMAQLERAAGGKYDADSPFKQVDLPGANNSSSVTTCSNNGRLKGGYAEHADGGADD